MRRSEMGTVIPFHAALDSIETQTLRKARQHIAEARRLKAESERIRRHYAERRRVLDELMAALERRWASGG